MNKFPGNRVSNLKYDTCITGGVHGCTFILISRLNSKPSFEGVKRAGGETKGGS